MVIGIIGGGASGMAAAIAAAENQDAQVVLLERQARVGKKLLATGNGRCNLTNLKTSAPRYHGEDPTFAAPAMEAMDVGATLDWFRKLGLLTVAEDSGRVYPYSDQANSVVDVLRFGLQQPNIQLKTGFEVTRVRRELEGFRIDSAEETIHCDRLIIACGGLAGTKLGGSMSGYKLLRSFGHRVTRLRPTLVQLKSGWHGCVSLKGVRANCCATIYHNDAAFSGGRGEIQFTDYGISGPVIFEISRDVCAFPGKWRCVLDLLPDMNGEQLAAELVRRTEKLLPAEELLTGILHNRLGKVIVTTAGIRGQRSCADLTEAELSEIVRLVKTLEIELTEPMGMDSAQVTAGGIVTADFDETTMESRLVPGLFACGEVLDIDGDCGGFNLQWAWSSGILAGRSAAEVEK